MGSGESQTDKILLVVFNHVVQFKRQGSQDYIIYTSVHDVFCTDLWGSISHQRHTENEAFRVIELFIQTESFS